MRYTVKQIADLAGVSPRTLRFYDKIGLLRPSAYEENGYRQYSDAELYRLQQILFYKEMGMDLEGIKAILNRPDFDVLRALQDHRAALEGQIERLFALIDTVDNTILDIQGKKMMSKKALFDNFSEESQKQYDSEVRQRWGDQAYEESWKRLNSYTPEQKEQIRVNGEAIWLSFADAMGRRDPADPAVQAQVAALQQHMNWFYPCTLEILEGLGHGYVADPRFTAFFDRIKPGLAAYLEQAITRYCQDQKR